MEKIKITWLEDYHDCETCGSSYAVGAMVEMGDMTISMQPVAHCYESQNHYPDDVYKFILSELGYEVEEVDD